MYPGYLVFFTSVIGAFLTFRLNNEKKIDFTFYWMTLTIYLTKLSLLLSIDLSELLSILIFSIGFIGLFSQSNSPKNLVK